jgi:hypothetical protein
MISELLFLGVRGGIFIEIADSHTNSSRVRIRKYCFSDHLTSIIRTGGGGVEKVLFLGLTP